MTMEYYIIAIKDGIKWSIQAKRYKWLVDDVDAVIK